MIVAVPEAAERLRKGELVAYPTETVYGLGADATCPHAVDLLFARKGLERARGVSVLIGDPDALETWVPDLPERARELIRRFWPGPLTIVLPTPALQRVATKSGVGFRCSSHPTALALARALGRPLVATSCNPTGEPPCRTAAEVERAFGPELVVAGGEPAGGLPPSTVVAVDARGRLDVLRAGALLPERLAEAGRK